MPLNNIRIVIQCRDNSKRLRHKSVRPFYKGKSILEIIIKKFRHLPYPITVTTSLESDLTIEQSKKAGVDIMLGEEGDVLSRFVEVINKYQLDGVIRVCADNPFIQLPLMYPIMAWGDMCYDYVAFDHCMQREEGFWVEYISAYALKEAKRLNTSPYEREHVTFFTYTHDMDYKVKWLPIPPELECRDIRLTVDTKKDFERAQRVYKKVRESHWYNIIDYFEGRL